MKIPLCKASLGDEEKKIINEVIDSRVYVGGEKTKKFEEEFAEYIGAKYAMSFNSCTSALHSIILALEIKGKIAVPSFTFVASANSIRTAGCEPVFVDISSETFNMDPNSLERALEKYPDIKAVMVVHYAGQSCDMDRLQEIADKNNLIIIEDSAETCGGEYNGRKTGSFSFGCFSFFPTKNMTTGEGGMVTFNESELLEKLKALRGHGITGKKENSWERSAILPGYNFRMGEINAAMGLAQLKKLEEMNDKRIKIAEKYNPFLKQFSEITIPKKLEGVKHVYQMYVIKLKDSIDRDNFVMKLREKGIEASVHFDPPVHLQDAYLNSEKVELSNTENVYKRVVTLPIYPDMTNEEIDYVCKSIKKILK
jgi:perosamine synthetase